MKIMILGRPLQQPNNTRSVPSNQNLNVMKTYDAYSLVSLICVPYIIKLWKLFAIFAYKAYASML